ncbi:hypothetical protein PM01_15935 [Sulfitobacter pontiacus 3SOLIMAR09]|nr:hypothetical protein PM01_15935 [Sulfitobacter pontiacus 3SOLIMAR09]
MLCNPNALQSQTEKYAFNKQFPCAPKLFAMISTRIGINVGELQ